MNLGGNRGLELTSLESQRSRSGADQSTPLGGRPPKVSVALREAVM